MALPQVREAATSRIATAPKARDRLDVELMRVVAALAVIDAHVCAYVNFGPENRAGAMYWTALPMSAVARIAVPIFFAVAGWIVLVKRPPRTMSDAVTRLWRVALPFAVWVVLYSVWEHWPPGDVLSALRNGGPLPGFDLSASAGEAAKGALLGAPVPGHLWFLAAYIPLILALSVAVVITRAALNHEPITATMLIGAAGVLGFAALGSVLIVLDSLGAPTWSSGWNIPLYAVAYALGGAVLLHNQRPSRFVKAAAAIAAAATLVFVTWWSSHYDGFALREYNSWSVAVLVIAAVLLLSGTAAHALPADWVRQLGRATYGIYLVHLMVLYYVHKAVDSTSPLPADSGWMALRLPLEVVVTFALSAALALVWRRSARLATLLG